MTDTSLLVQQDKAPPITETVSAEPAATVSWTSLRTRVFVGILALLAVSVVTLFLREWHRYRIDAETTIPLQEFSEVDYPEDPSGRSPHYGKYCGRQLKLIQRDATHFDFINRASQYAAQRFRDIVSIFMV